MVNVPYLACHTTGSILPGVQRLYLAGKQMDGDPAAAEACPSAISGEVEGDRTYFPVLPEEEGGRVDSAVAGDCP